MAFFFPNHGRPGFTLDVSRSIVGAAGIPSRLTWHQWDDGVVVKLGVGPSGSQGVVYGELEFCNGSCDAPTVEREQPLVRSITQAADRFASLDLTSFARRSVQPEDDANLDEGRLDRLISMLPEDTRARLRLRLTPAASSLPDWDAVSKSIKAISLPAAQGNPPAPPPPRPPVPIEEDRSADARRVARELNRNSARTLSRLTSRDDAGAAARQQTVLAIRNAIGDEQFRRLLEAVRRQ